MLPGHSSIQGHEVTYELARNGSAIPFTSPMPAIGISSSLIRKKKYLNWLSSKGQRQAKELNQGCPSVRHMEHFKLNRKGMRKVICLVTGHCPLSRHLAIMGVKNETHL